MRDSDGDFLYEVTNSTVTVPNIDSLHSCGVSIDSHPDEWFNIFLPIYRVHILLLFSQIACS